MPELPEVETTRRGLAPHICGRPILAVRVHEPRLRWPVPSDLARLVTARPILGIDRRAKYLLLRCAEGTLLVHLGMSGSLRLDPAGATRRKHDHVEFEFAGGACLRLHDPRRFGALLWVDGEPLQHPLLARLGPEPLDGAFDGAWLYQRSHGRRAPVKAFIMDARTVAGVGNIYATEALYIAGIHPARAAGRIGARRYGRLADSIRQVLGDAIEQGGTTLRDYVNGTGAPGYFRLQLRAYGHSGGVCERCGGELRQRIIAQRSSVYCVRCQR